jgi:hypothetical protein
MKKFSPISMLLLLLVVVMLLAAGTMGFAETGKVTGTGADLTVTTGFVPSHVRVVNVNGSSMEWFNGMADDSAVKLTNATDGTARALTLANGITPVPAVYNATTGQVINTPGFAIGADTDVNVLANTIFYQADR